MSEQPAKLSNPIKRLQYLGRQWGHRATRDAALLGARTQLDNTHNRKDGRSVQGKDKDKITEILADLVLSWLILR